jgi:hypothetical protein
MIRFEKMALSDTEHHSELLGYATKFLDSILTFAKGLSDADLSETLNRAGSN